MTSDVISEIANLALALSFIVGLIFGIVQVRAAARDRRERLTLETLREFQTREFVELLHYISFHDLPSDREGMMALPPNERTLLIQFGQEMESLGILVAERLINIDLVDKTLGSFVTTSWEKYKDMFLDIREKQPDPFLGEYFQWLAEQIGERMKINPREPFYKTRKSTLDWK
jgi:hypothetical protein